MGVSLKTAKRKSHIAIPYFGQRVRRAEVVRGIAARLCYPWYFHAPPRIIFVFQF
ncbi:MAG: hypothetical protein JW836_16485 [Deltaproteobacteria bacterium]|nr:hypothetical protein [Deltaproteobacteria bacterium]